MPAIGLGWIGYIAQSMYRKERNRRKIPATTETKTKATPRQNEQIESSVSRVPTTIDPEQSQISYYGAAGLRVEVYITIENGLDIEARLSKLELKADTANGKSELQVRRISARPVRRLHPADRWHRSSRQERDKRLGALPAQGRLTNR